MPIAIKNFAHFNVSTVPIAAGVRATPTNVGYFADYGALTEINPGDSLTETIFEGNASWDGNVLRITAGGFTMENIRLNTGIYCTINSDTLTIRNCVIDRSGENDAFCGVYHTGTGALLKAYDCTVLDSAPNSNGTACLKSDSGLVEIYRCDLSGFEDVWQAGPLAVIDQAYCHHLDDTGADPHNDVGQYFPGGGASLGASLTNSYLECSGLDGNIADGRSGCWTMYDDGSVCRNNYMSMAPYNLRLGNGSNFVIEDNDFGVSDFADVTIDGTMTIASWSNNRDEAGELIAEP